MTIYQEEGAKLRRHNTQKAINLAMQSRWEEAVQVNRAILDLFPNDVDALNRLGKALSELGNYEEAREAYRQALEIDSLNTIAQKNLSRLAYLDSEQPVREEGVKLSPQLFIEERGKAGVTSLVNLGSRGTLARVAAGDHVQLRPDDGRLVVETLRGETLGQVEPKLGLRLLRLMEGGNRYMSAVTTINEQEVRVIIREVYQHPSQAGRRSFPTAGPEGFRAYTREGVLKYDVEEEEMGEEDMGLEEEPEGLPEGFTVIREPILAESQGLEESPEE